jgi:hypothetical protein
MRARAGEAAATGGHALRPARRGLRGGCHGGPAVSPRSAAVRPRIIRGVCRAAVARAVAHGHAPHAVGALGRPRPPRPPRASVPASRLPQTRDLRTCLRRQWREGLLRGAQERSVARGPEPQALQARRRMQGLCVLPGLGGPGGGGRRAMPVRAKPCCPGRRWPLHFSCCPPPGPTPPAHSCQNIDVPA